jgi:hypothetical protein
MSEQIGAAYAGSADGVATIEGDRRTLDVPAVSLFELLHPDGPPARCRVLGGDCPPVLVPAAAASPAGSGVDVLLLAPTLEELGAGSEWRRAVHAAVESLGVDGIVCVVGSYRVRARVRPLLRAAGLTSGETFVHRPGWTPDQQVASLRVALSPLGGEILAWRGWRNRAAAAVARLPRGERVLSRRFDHVSEIARRPGRRPLFDWLTRMAGEDGSSGTAVVRIRRRGPRATALLHLITNGGRAVPMLAKLRLDETSSVSWPRDVECLERLAAGAADTGARLPGVARLRTTRGYPVVMQTRLAGRQAARLIAESPKSAVGLTERVAHWLAAWNRATAQIASLRAEWLQSEVLADVALLAPRLDGGAAYGAWMARRCAASVGVPTPLVAAHRDLTMANVLVDDSGMLGIVDWEAATDAALPLGDFFYAVADAAAARHHYVDRLADFFDCFVQPSETSAAVSALGMRAAAMLGVAPELVLLAFHACWLHHAANEERDGSPDGTWPFRRIAQWLAAHHADWRPAGWQ